MKYYNKLRVTWQVKRAYFEKYKVNVGISAGYRVLYVGYTPAFLIIHLCL